MRLWQAGKGEHEHKGKKVHFIFGKITIELGHNSG